MPAQGNARARQCLHKAIHALRKARRCLHIQPLDVRTFMALRLKPSTLRTPLSVGSAMATFAAAKRDMLAIQNFLESQRELGLTKELYDGIEASQADNLASMVDRIKKLSTAEGESLTSALSKGNWGAAAKDKLAKAIADRVKNKLATNGTQECDDFANFPTAAEYENFAGLIAKDQ